MWTIDTTAKLYELIGKQKLSWKKAAEVLGTSDKACERKFARTDWDAFHKLKNNPDSILADPVHRGEWTESEMILLHALRVESRPPLSYLEIAKKINRTPTACERMFQTTNWNEFLEEIKHPSQAEESKLESQSPKRLTESLADAMVELSRCNITRLEEITRHELLAKTGLQEAQMPCEFKVIKALAQKRLAALGLNYPEELRFEEGVYLVVGDSHGKHTKRGVFSLLKNLSKHVKAKKVIHLGHALDDDSELSYCWEEIDNLLILSRREELQRLMDLNFPYDIARSKIYLGNLMLSNQDYINDYVQSFVGNLKRNHFEGSTIVNLHRQELATRTTGGEDKDRVQIASPGCLCETHIIKAVRQMDFSEGGTVKLTHPDSFSRYRRMEDLSKGNWEQGVCIVKVDAQKRFDIIQCRIFKTSKGYSTSYFNKIITESGTFEPEHKIFFNGDAHCRNHNHAAFDIQEQFCKDYKPNIIVNLGDLIDNRACNHHQMERNGWAIPGEDIIDEMASAQHVLKRMSAWGEELYLLLGNHERFAKDIADKFPQFQRIFNNDFMLGLDKINPKLTGFKRVLKIGDIKFNHGDMKMFGAKGGSKIEKIFNTFGRNSIVGHLHSPTIRNGCYMVGLSGELDQDYNEPEASSWMHGFGQVNVFEGISFISLVNIRDRRTWIGGKYYVARNTDVWATPEYEATINFNFK